jgi:hypothetical protein
MNDHPTRTYQIVDEGCLHKYRTEIPNTVIRGIRSCGLSLPARWLYCYLKSVAGDQGECWQNTTTLAKGAQLARGTVSAAKHELIKAGLIAVVSRGRQYHDTDRIRILDIWDANMREFAAMGCSPHEQPPPNGCSPHEQPTGAPTPTQSTTQSEVVHRVNSGCSSHELGCSSGELEEDPYEEDPKEEPLMRERSILDKVPRKANVDKGHSVSFERFWQAYPVKKGKGDAWKAWDKARLDPLVERICASVADHLVHDTEWQRGYIKYPATFLNGRCWEDELTPVALPCPPPKRRGLVL